MPPFGLPTWQRVLDSIEYEVPPAHRVSFARAIAFGNWQRTAVLSLLVAITNTFLGIIPAVFILLRAEGELRATYLVQISWHIGIVLFGAVIWRQARRMAPPDETAATPQHQRLALIFCSVMLAAMALFSVFKHRTSGDIAMYLIGVAAVGTLFYLPSRFCAWLYMLTFAGLVAGMIVVPGDPVITWIHAGEALVAISIFWVGSRLVHGLKALSHVQLTTISRQREELAAANRELAAANQFKADLLAHVAHDLRDPLNTIALSAQALQLEVPPDSPARPLAATIAERCWHMGDFIRKLLSDIASDAHEMTLDRTPVALSDFVAEAVAKYRSLAAAKEITIHFATDASARSAPPASIDPVRFRQVVDNLVTNAIKYSPGGRNVWISVDYAPGKGHRLVVRDEGPGLTAQDRQRLFARFQRLSARPTGGEVSTGLGLAIVKQIVQLHGGRVSANSAGPDQGATFTVSMPER